MKAVVKGPTHVGHLEEQWNPTKRAYLPRANGEAKRASRKVYHQGNPVEEEWQARRDVRTPEPQRGECPVSIYLDLKQPESGHYRPYLSYLPFSL